MPVVLCDLVAPGWKQLHTPVVMAQDLQALLADMHEEVIQQVLEDLKNGDRKARAEAMTLLKQNNVSATAAEGSTLRQLAGKLDFSAMADRVVEFKKPRSEAG
jgi:NAD-specific glutamate dehydrogenase